jgi:hypothetical protein
MDTDMTSSTTVDLAGLPDPVVQSLKALVESLRAGARHTDPSPLRGRFADPALSIPKEDIDEVRREAWASFPRDFPDPGE